MLQSALLHELAVMDASRGWAQQYHLGVLRGLNTRLGSVVGPDSGFDSIGDVAQARSLARFLDRLDRDGRLARTILYNLNPSDNDLMAAMIGNFQDGTVRGKMQLGTAWWFNDQIDGMRAQMAALSNSGVISAFVGMVTDSRSFLSYPRHDYFRRLLCAACSARTSSAACCRPTIRISAASSGTSASTTRRATSGCREWCRPAAPAATGPERCTTAWSGTAPCWPAGWYRCSTTAMPMLPVAWRARWWRAAPPPSSLPTAGPGALRVFQAVAERPEFDGVASLGVGSVIDAPTAALFIAAGARFVVSPIFNTEVARLCNRRRIPYLPGCATPTEIAAAEEWGVEIVKVFPGKVGGPAFIRDVLGPMPWSRLMPTGGVQLTAASLTEWFAAGACCVGMGSDLVRSELVAARDYRAISANVRTGLTLIREIRAS